MSNFSNYDSYARSLVGKLCTLNKTMVLYPSPSRLGRDSEAISPLILDKALVLILQVEIGIDLDDGGREQLYKVKVLTSKSKVGWLIFSYSWFKMQDVFEPIE